MADDKTPTVNIPTSGLTGGAIWVEPGHKVVVTYNYSDPATVKQLGDQARAAFGRFVSVDEHDSNRCRLHIFLTPQ